jgi:hypothetical protein
MNILIISFSAHFFLKVHLHHFSKIKKVQKKSQNSKNQGFSYCFCLTIEGSGSGAGSVPRTNVCGSGSGSRRPKTSGSATLVVSCYFSLFHPRFLVEKVTVLLYLCVCRRRWRGWTRRTGCFRTSYLWRTAGTSPWARSSR